MTGKYINNDAEYIYVIPVVFNGAYNSCFVVLFLSLDAFSPVVERIVFEKRKVVLAVGDPAAGESGFFYYMVYPHQAAPAVAYASNLSTASAYEYATSGTVSCTGETPFGTAFDLVVKVGVNVTDGWNTTDSRWDDSFVWCTLSCADLGVGADTNMTEYQIANNSGYRWMQYVLNNGGVGYTIVEGQSFNVTSVKQWVKRLVT